MAHAGCGTPGPGAGGVVVGPLQTVDVRPKSQVTSDDPWGPGTRLGEPEVSWTAPRVRLGYGVNLGSQAGPRADRTLVRGWAPVTRDRNPRRDWESRHPLFSGLVCGVWVDREPLPRLNPHHRRVGLSHRFNTCHPPTGLEVPEVLPPSHHQRHPAPCRVLRPSCLRRGSAGTV